MNGTPSHYDALGVPRDATYEEIKESFHRLARAKHPDKQQQRSASEEQSVAAEFRRIQKAWKVLRDPKERSAYDSDLLHKDLKEESRRNGAIVLSYHDDLEKAIDEETNERFMVYDCRCGEEIQIDAGDGDGDGDVERAISGNGDGDNEILFDCPGCCFVYRIIGK